jgi:magnesium transporter
MKVNKIIRKRPRTAGLVPGTLVHVGERKMEVVRITVIDYDEKTINEKQIANIEECFEFKTTPTVTWINIDGLHDIELVEKMGKYYEIHPLVLEDIVNTTQRPKFEDMDTYIFIVLKMLTYNDEQGTVQSEQVSVILSRGVVISFQECVGDVFENIRERLRTAKGRVRSMGADYLMYTLLDAVVDNYFTVLEKLGERIEDLEERLVSNPTEQMLRQIHKIKRELISLRKSVWPLREVISSLERSESGLIKKVTGVYLRDVYDHTIQVIDTLESFRDMASGVLDIYLSSISNRMNAVMKVLTIIATIFIPLTFIAGIYGMNFKYMPELEWKWGYLTVWLVMIAVVIIMLTYFRKKKWL